MRFLKTLQKKQIEQPLDHEALDNVVSPNEVKGERLNKPPDFPLIRDSKISKPNLTFGQEPDSVIELAPLSARETQNAEQVRPHAFEAEQNVEQTPPNSFEPTIINPLRVNSRLVAITDPNSAYCEEYRNLRTQILHKSQKQKLQSIVIASVGLSEGKSITALNLSWLLAQTDGIKTLVIDSDLRRPSLASYLGIKTQTGLSNVLEGESSIAEAIIRLDPAGLYLLPGGESRSDVAEQISGQNFKEISGRIREMFDYIIIDAPPLGVFTDASVLINQADGAILVVRTNQTRYKDVERVLEMLPREKMIGAVLNQSDDALIGSNYYYRYYDSKKS